MRSKRGRRERRSQAQWVEILRRFSSSGQGVHEFCRRQGLALSSFQRWRGRLGQVAEAEFVELIPASPSAASATTGWSFELALPNGMQLRLRG